MMCNICLEYIEGEQWGIIPVEIKSLDADPDNDWVDFTHDHVSLENAYIEEAKNG